MTCEDCVKGKKATKYIKVCQACRDEEEHAHGETEEEHEKKMNYAAELCC